MIPWVLSLIALASAEPLASAQDRAAIEVVTPNFQLVATVDDRTAIRAARYLETLDRRFRAMGFHPAALPSPRVRVLLVSDIAELEPYDRRAAGMEPKRGLFVAGIDRAWIASAQHAPGDPWTALAHEYVHRVFAAADLPRWLGEGAAEYLSRMKLVNGVAEFGFFDELDRQALRGEPWIRLESLLEGPARSMAQGPDFRLQSRLLVHWLATEGFDLRRMDRTLMEAHIAQVGAAAVETAMRGLLAGWPLPTRFAFGEIESARDAFQTREMTAAELQFVRADLLRETGQLSAARRELVSLGRRFPDHPEPFESLGALEMDRRRYETAERAFAAAVHNGSQDARTHYRYSLLLQRPLEGGDSGRAGAGVRHAEIARGLDPTQPLFLLTEGQARMAAGQWVRAARLLAELAERPAWGARARIELAELRRGRQQQWTTMGRELAPRLEENFRPAPGTREVHAVTAPALSPVPQPAPPRVVEAAPPPWPPPGTVLIYGHIRDVECRAGEKIVTLRTPRYTVKLREPAGRPATLYDKPKRLRGLECGTKGWEVNAVFKMLRGDPEVRGELVGVVF